MGGLLRRMGRFPNLLLNQIFASDVDGINHVQAVAGKGGIIRTETAFEGVIFKGIGKDYKLDNLEEYLVQGRLPNLKANLNEIMAKHTGRNVEEIGERTERDHFLDALEAKDLGLVDKVLTSRREIQAQEKN